MADSNDLIGNSLFSPVIDFSVNYITNSTTASAAQAMSITSTYIGDALPTSLEGKPNYWSPIYPTAFPYPITQTGTSAITSAIPAQPIDFDINSYIEKRAREIAEKMMAEQATKQAAATPQTACSQDSKNVKPEIPLRALTKREAHVGFCLPHWQSE